MNNEKCSKCGQPMTCGHSWSVDGSRANFRLCCLCTGELLILLTGKTASEDR